MNTTDELLRTLFKMKEDFIKFHGTCGLNKARNTMKRLNLHTIVSMRLQFHVTSKCEYLTR